MNGLIDGQLRLSSSQFQKFNGQKGNLQPIMLMAAIRLFGARQTLGP